MATLAVGVARGLSFAQMVPAIHDYEPRPHRCEFVRELDGIEIRQRLEGNQPGRGGESLGRAQTKPVVLIAGGKDKGFTFDPLRSLVKDKVKSAVLIGEMAENITALMGRRGQIRNRNFTRRRGRARAQSGQCRATSSSSLPAHHRSTCSKVTPIAAINFANWCKRSRNETD